MEQMVSDDILSDLRRAREQAAQRYAQAESDLKRIERALAELEASGKTDPEKVLRRNEYTGLGITEAVERLLREDGGGKTTKEIADTLIARGVKTKSKRFVPTVYATLLNQKHLFKRSKDLWFLKHTD